MGWVGAVSSQKMERYRLLVASLYAEVRAYCYYVNMYIVKRTRPLSSHRP